MWPYLPQLLARPVPRYTSFPTAAEFHAGIGPAAMEAALDAIARDTAISLYVHIPYCREICWYCGCNTGAANRVARLSAYLEALAAEIDLLAVRIGGRVRIARIAFGGGSPNAVAPAELAAIVARLRDRFDAPAPLLSIELDPRSFDDGWMEMLATTGFTRASLGVQSFDPAVQARIGRVQPAELIARVTRDLRTTGITSLNFDLMYGLPGQDLDELEASLAAAIALAPDRLAVFGYAHVPHLLPRQRRIDADRLPDQYARFRQAAFAHHLLSGAGYRPIGFDHFARPGDPLAVAAEQGQVFRNFQGFTDDPAEVLIGLGASAISQFPGLLVQNDKSAGRYRMLAAAGRFPVERGIVRSGEDQARGRIIADLLCRGEARVPPSRFPDARAGLAPFETAGLLDWAGDRLALRPEALPYARAIAAAFDPYRQQDVRRFSSAV